MPFQDEHFPICEGFPRPDWETIHQIIAARPQREWKRLWADAAMDWMQRTYDQLPEDYRLLTSKNFLVLSSEPDAYARLLVQFFERALRYIVRGLKGIANDEGLGKHVAFVFSDEQSFYDYTAFYHPDDRELPLASGQYLNFGYGHFVFPYLDIREAEAVAAHELTHACLAHLPIPAWLNEGLATSIEDEMCGTHPLRLAEEMDRHRNYWNAETIQEFWSGRAFTHNSEGFSLSYDLARSCVQALARNYRSFRKFANAAQLQDGGEAAARAALGAGLGGLIEQFFGPGQWEPRPQDWARIGSTDPGPRSNGPR